MTATLKIIQEEYVVEVSILYVLISDFSDILVCTTEAILPHSKSSEGIYLSLRVLLHQIHGLGLEDRAYQGT